MPLVRTARSGTFTPANGSLLVAIWTGCQSGAAAWDVLNATISGGGLTWTRQLAFQRTGIADFNSGVVIWTAPVVTGASTTVVVTTPANTYRTGIGGEFTRVIEYSGQAASFLGALSSGQTALLDGLFSTSLSAAPASASDVLAALVNVTNGAGTGVVDVGSGWTSVSTLPGDDGVYGVVQARTGSTSSTIEWADLNGATSANSSYNGAAWGAIEILAASDTPTTCSVPLFSGGPFSAGPVGNYVGPQPVSSITGAIAETFALTETTNSGASFAVAVTESFALADSQNAIGVFLRAVAEAFALADSQDSTVAGSSSATTETFALADSQSVIAVREGAVNESFALADITNVSASYPVAVAESFALADAQNSFISYLGDIAEAFGLTDAQDARSTRIGAVAETFGLVDAQSASVLFVSGVGETFGLADAQNALTVRVGVVSESFTLTDSQDGSTFVILTGAIVESFTLTDSQDATGGVPGGAAASYQMRRRRRFT